MSLPETFLTRATAAAAGASVWLSLGAMAVVRDDTRIRVVALPPVWQLAVAVIVPLLAAWVTKPPLRRIAPLAITGLIWLPYIPGAIPPAFLIWHGPIQIGVWMVAVSGLIVLNLRVPAPQSALTSPSIAPWIAAVIAAVAFAAGAASLRRVLPVGDEPHYLMMTQSLIKDGDLRIENNHRNRDYASFYPVDIPPHYLTRGVDGEIYSTHAPGVSVLVLPAFALFGYYGGVATVILCVAVASAMGWHAAWLLTGAASAAWVSWAAIFLTAPVYLHAITVFPDAVGTLPVIAGAWLLVALEMGRRLRLGEVVGVSGLLAMLPWLHSRFAVIAAGLGLAIAVRLVRRAPRYAMAFLAVPAVSAALWLAFFWIIWGTPSPAAPWGAGLTAKLAWVPRGIAGLLSDQQAGLLPSAPVYLCAIVGWLVLMRRRPRLALETAVIACSLIASVASYEPWWGGQGGPARYIVAVLPLAVPAIAIGAAVRNGWARHATVVTLTVSILVLVARVVHEQGAYAFFPEGGTNPLLRWLSPSVDGSRTLPSLVATRDAHFIPVDWPAGIPAGAIWLTTMIAVAWLCRLGARTTTHRITIAMLAGSVTVMIATSGVWRWEGQSGLSPFDSTQAFLAQWDPSRQPVSLQWRRPYLTSPAQVAHRIELMLPPDRAVALPAGTYELFVDQQEPASRAELTGTIGDSSPPLFRRELEAKRSTGPLLLRLPVAVAGLHFNVVGAQTSASVRLRLDTPPLPGTARATRAGRLGDWRLFFIDESAYPEPGGFWTRPGVETRIVVDREDGSRRNIGLRLRSGPVAATVDVAVNGQTRQLTFAPAQQQEMEIPATDARMWNISIRPYAGFRPVDFDPQIADSRSLGVWFEVF